VFNYPPIYTPKLDALASGITAFNPLAKPLFERARWWGDFHRSIGRLVGRGWQLPALSDVVGAGYQQRTPECAAQTVWLDQIRGSVNRSDDFERHFYPLTDRLETRWVRIASMLLQQTPLPPVELIQVGAAYFVQDGHHRISALRMLKRPMVDALIVAVYYPE
jgi:hypothetical protein